MGARRDEARGGGLDEVLASLAEGLRAIAVLLWAVHAVRRSRSCSTRSARPTRRSAPRRSARGSLAADRRARAAVPQAAVIDSHTHLDSCEPPDDELVAAAREAGLTRILTVGMDRESGRAALAAAEHVRRGVRGDRPPPQRDDGRRPTPTSTTSRCWRAHERCVAIGETGLDYLPRPRAARRPGARVSRSRSSSRVSWQAADHPHASRRRRHDRDARAPTPTGSRSSCTASRCPIAWRVRRSAAGGSRSPATSPTRRPATSPRPRRAAPADRLLVETDAPVPVAAGRAQAAQPARLRRPHSAVRRAAAAGRPTRSSTRWSTRNAATLFWW